MTELYLDLLDVERKKVFQKLACIKNEGVLAGGTALCLQIGKRYSYDFDIFFEKNNIPLNFETLAKKIPVKKKLVDQSRFITFLTKKEIQITLFYYQHKPLYPLVKTKSLSLFHYFDIAADKAFTLGRRPAWRDYVDIFFLLKNKYVSLEKMIKDAKRKFKAEFAPKLFLEQLAYYGDIKEFKVDFVGKPYTRQEIENFLQNQIRQYVGRELEL